MPKHRKLGVGDVVQFSGRLVRITSVDEDRNSGENYGFRGANHEDPTDNYAFIGNAQDAVLVVRGV